MRSDGLGQLMRIGNRTTEGTGYQHALSRAGVLDDIMAGDAAQFEGKTLADHAGDTADKTRIGLGEVDGRKDAMGTQARRQARTDAPDVFRFDAAQEGRAAGRIDWHHDHAAARLVGLGPLVGQLAQHLGRSHPQGDRDARALQHVGPDAQAQRPRIGVRHIGKPQEGLVDRIHLEVACLLAEGGHHAFGEIAVDLEVGREDPDAMGFASTTDFEIRRTHRDTQRLGLGRTRDHAAVVVRQHHDRHADQRRVEGTLARGVEIITVGEGAEHGVSSGARRRPLSPRYGIPA